MKSSQDKLETAYNILGEVETMLHTLKSTQGQLEPSRLEHMCEIICRRQSSPLNNGGYVSKEIGPPLITLPDNSPTNISALDC
ncbi:MAG: hypothetical protein IIB74_09425, partial [Proteobacteria bacterium]|nr:hypothetical protein [Pseudomonadota bacterium]